MGMAEQTRLAYLAAMGVQAWNLRLVAPPLAPPTGTAEAGAAGPALDALDEAGPIPANTADPSNDPTPPRQTGQEPPVLKPALRHAPGSLFEDENPRPLPATAPSCGWDELQAQVKACTLCPLHQTRTQTVFGVGDPDADWMVVGEAPGEQEDLQGEPFVGRAGLLLNEMLRAMGLAREQVFIANILKCRPPKNRDPQPDEVAACENYLKQQLALVRPKIILAVGRVAAQNLLKTTTPIGKLRGSVRDYQGVPLVVTYHPAYLLRSPLEKRNAFDDLRLALRTYRQIP